MKLQRLYSLTRQAIEDYQMIEENDKIVLGLSGGKDSFALLYALSGLQKFYPSPFLLEAVCVDLGFEEMDFSSVVELCNSLQVPCHIVKTKIAEIVFTERKERNPCSLCAKMRKGALNQKAIELGFHKIAYAHHQDDAVETVLMSLLYEGRFSCFSPVTFLEQTKLTVIRPFLYLSEADLIGFQKKYNLPVITNPCPMDQNSKRASIKQTLRSLNMEYPKAKQHLFSALTSSNIAGWKPKS